GRMLENASITRDEFVFASLRRHDTGSDRLVVFMPVTGDVDAPCDPYLVVALHVIEEAFQRGCTAWTSDKAAMQANGHHLRRAFRAFAVEHVERVFQIGEELVAGVETLRRCKAHVIGVQRIGYDQMRSVRSLHP